MWLGTIEIRIIGDSWIARFPIGEMEPLFATRDLPTPFTASAPAAKVIAALKRLNPLYCVRLAERT